MNKTTGEQNLFQIHDSFSAVKTTAETIKSMALALSDSMQYGKGCAKDCAGAACKIFNQLCDLTDLLDELYLHINNSVLSKPTVK